MAKRKKLKPVELTEEQNDVPKSSFAELNRRKEMPNDDILLSAGAMIIVLLLIICIPLLTFRKGHGRRRASSG